MFNYIFAVVLITVAVVAMLTASIGLVGAAQFTARRGYGYIHWVLPVMLLVAAVHTVLSGRDLTTTALSLMEQGDMVRHPVELIFQPLASIFILAASAERVISRWIRPGKGAPVPVMLLVSFIVFWLATVASPALLGAHPYISHDYTYSLIMGVAVMLVSSEERDLTFRAARDALFAFVLVSLLLIPIQPRMVMDVAYSQGIFPGLPRLAGLAAHAVLLGVLAQVSLITLLAVPYKRRWLTLMGWTAGLAALFLSQSKTSWISFILCTLCIVLVRRGPGFLRRAGDPLRSDFGIVALLGFMAVVLGASVLVMFGDLGAKVSGFFDSSEGAQLASLTGRDQIWAIAYGEWQRNPLFGYGPTLWNADFRTLIGMPNATHGHNQFMDTLSRSGTIGAAALVFYSLVLLTMSIRYTRASGGLTLALFLVVALRAVSEVPLLLFGYGAELITHMLLLISLAAAASTQQAAAKIPRTFKVPSPSSTRANLGITGVNP